MIGHAFLLLLITGMAWPAIASYGCFDKLTVRRDGKLTPTSSGRVFAFHGGVLGLLCFGRDDGRLVVLSFPTGTQQQTRFAHVTYHC